MRETCNESVLEAVAKKLGTTKSKVREVYEAQSAFTVNEMENGRFNAVQWIYLGKIKPKIVKLYHVNLRKGLL